MRDKMKTTQLGVILFVLIFFFSGVGNGKRGKVSVFYSEEMLWAATVAFAFNNAYINLYKLY